MRIEKTAAIRGAAGLGVGFFAWGLVAVSAAGASAASAVQAAPAPIKAAAVQCTASDMAKTTGGVDWTPEKISSSGDYVVGDTYEDGPLEPVYWHDGKAETVDVGSGSGDFYDVNSSGVAVGYHLEGGVYHAITYQNGQMVHLPGGEGGRARAINNDGVIAGDINGKPVVWQDAQTEPRQLETPNSPTVPVAVDDAGTVYGNGYVGGGDPEQPYKWSADGTRSTVSLTIFDDARGGSVADASSNGWAAGSESRVVSGGGYNQVAVALWSPDGKDTQLDFPVTPLYQYSYVFGVNAKGWTVGRQDTDGVGTVVIADGEKMKLTGTNGNTLIDASDIADNGTVVGDGKTSPLMWTCG